MPIFFAMRAEDLALAAVLIVFAINAIAVTGMIVLKAAHRRRDSGRARRKAGYLTLLSKHLMFENHTEPITRKAASDEAFLDAIIDMRNTVAGPQVDKLAEIANRYGIVDDRVRRMKSRFPLGRRLRSAVALAEMGDIGSFDDLLAHLDDPEDEIKIQCARGLGRIGDVKAIGHLLKRFESEVPWVRARFADTLIGFRARASEPVMDYVAANHTGPRPDIVAELIRVLWSIGDTRVGPRLTQILVDSEDREVRIASVQALGSVGGALALPAVLAAYRSDDWQVASKAATSLGDIGDPNAIPDLADGLTNTVWWIRRNSAAALARLPGGVPELYNALTSTDPFARDAAAEALDDVGELATARALHERGEASRDQLRLIRHMRGHTAVPA